ncbi:hypothetical protein Gogos_000137 [Gossypium gossypioides]|uniref:DUF4283 domain-containing protein n=1 Tax=Gossypium gossypioides TaxID=34282 RepID=A0A7J9D7T6_GOSGO|nr:hypothetical protein [Gossypium gossypioides]
MRVALANVWHALDGVSISDLEEKHFLFLFYNEIYIDCVVEGDPLQVPLFSVNLFGADCEFTEWASFEVDVKAI